MRILNRPMFRYGGPIKEGVMHGMRNNYQSGQLVRPGPGRPGYQGKIPKSKLGIAGWLGKKIPFLKQPITKLSTSTKDIIPRAGQYFKNLFGSTPSTVKHTGKIVQPPFQLNPVGKYIVGSPEAQLAKSLYAGKGIVTKPLKWTATQAVKSPLVVGGLIWTGVNWVRKDGSPANENEIAEAKNIAGKGEGWDPGAGADQIITQSMKDKIAKDAQNKRLKSYLDMMGYDRSKKTAMSDALIDASALVQDATTEAGSIKHADWGKLINKMIQTTSKRYDKPEQIREAVGLMSVKAAIQKDMEDPEAKKLRRMQIKKIEDELEGNSFAENKILTAKNAPGQAGYDLAVEITKGKNFKGNLIDSTEWVESLEDMKDDPDFAGLNEKQLVKGYTEKLIKGKNYEDGDYTVGDNLVTIKDSLVIAVE